MHFWIDKRSQGCGFNVRRQVPPSISGYGRNQRILCGSFYPKPMVTPVHRFQSIESVANNGLRYARSPGYLARIHNQCPPSVHYNGSTSNIRMGRSLEMIAPGNTPTTRNNPSANSKLKCGVWVFFTVLTVLLACFGINIGVTALLFCWLFAIILVIGGLISLCHAAISPNTRSSVPTEPPVHIPEQETEVLHHQPPASALSQNSAEMPPPPYHIAVMLSPQSDMDTIQVICDSPPPSYEKAVT